MKTMSTILLNTLYLPPVYTTSLNQLNTRHHIGIQRHNEVEHTSLAFKDMHDKGDSSSNREFFF